MADVVNATVRSRMMAGIRGRNTRPEMAVRHGLHRRGFRYTLHSPRLPGKPDIVFPRHQAIVLVHGCFWHGHDCHLFRWPSSRTEFWKQKILRNRARDAEVKVALTAAGWRILTVWECALKGREQRPLEDVLSQVAAWIKGDSGMREIRGNLLGHH